MTLFKNIYGSSKESYVLKTDIQDMISKNKKWDKIEMKIYKIATNSMWSPKFCYLLRLPIDIGV
jgi:hypothetical protein